MPTEITKLKAKTYITKRFKDSFNSSNPDVTYIFVGNSLPYANSDTTIMTMEDCTYCEKAIWDRMILSKKVLSSDLEIVVKRYNWETGKIYKQFDDKTPAIDLITSDDLSPMYVINSERNVYKCISNNNGVPSIYEPIGNFTISDGFIEPSDGYIWKYMYNIKPSNKFLTDDWIPCPYDLSSENIYTEYSVSANTIIDGSLNLIVVENGGNNYIHTTTTSETFTSGSTYLTLPNLNNVKNYMSISGYGISPDTYITGNSIEYSRIFLSKPTIYSGGGGDLANNISITTRVDIFGDGTDTLTELTLANTSIDKISVTSMGNNYSTSNIRIYGTATDNIAVVRGVLPPKFGHGHSPALELNATNVMIVKRFGDIDATENGLYSTDISVRMYGLLRNPYKYGNTKAMIYAEANTVISQTLEVTLEAGNKYGENDYVYQGNSDKPTFSGYISSQTDFTLKIIKYTGSPNLGSLLTNGISVSRPIINFSLPELEKYTGDILYVNNISSVKRSLGQSEELKLIIEI